LIVFVIEKNQYSIIVIIIELLKEKQKGRYELINNNYWNYNYNYKYKYNISLRRCWEFKLDIGLTFYQFLQKTKLLMKKKKLIF